MKLRLWHVLLAMVLAAALALLALVVLLGHAVAPDPPAPDLLGTRPEPVVTHMGSGDAPPAPATEAAAFEEEDLCPLAVTVATDDGQPPDPERTGVWMRLGGIIWNAEAQGEGRWRLDGLPCGVGDLTVASRDYVSAERENVDTVVERSLTVTLVAGIWLRGVVTEPGGEPIAEAGVSADEEHDFTGEDGRYALRVDPARLTRVHASARGYLSHSQRLRLPADLAVDATLDLVLHPSSKVTVYSYSGRDLPRLG